MKSLDGRLHFSEENKNHSAFAHLCRCPETRVETILIGDLKATFKEVLLLLPTTSKCFQTRQTHDTPVVNEEGDLESKRRANPLDFILMGLMNTGKRIAVENKKIVHIFVI